MTESWKRRLGKKGMIKYRCVHPHCKYEWWSVKSYPRCPKCNSANVTKVKN